MVDHVDYTMPAKDLGERLHFTRTAEELDRQRIEAIPMTSVSYTRIIIISNPMPVQFIMACVVDLAFYIL